MIVDIEARMRPISMLRWEYRIAMFWWPSDLSHEGVALTLWRKVQ